MLQKVPCREEEVPVSVVGLSSKSSRRNIKPWDESFSEHEVRASLGSQEEKPMLDGSLGGERMPMVKALQDFHEKLKSEIVQSPM